MRAQVLYPPSAGGRYQAMHMTVAGQDAESSPGWARGNMIDVYGKMCEREARRLGRRRLVYLSHTMTNKLLSSRNGSADARKTTLRRWWCQKNTVNRNPLVRNLAFTVQDIVLPFQLSGNHWALMHVDFECWALRFYDSLNGRSADVEISLQVAGPADEITETLNVFDFVKGYLAEMVALCLGDEGFQATEAAVYQLESMKTVMEQTTQQINGFDCDHMRKVALNHPLTRRGAVTAESSMRLRTRVARDLYEKSIA